MVLGESQRGDLTDPGSALTSDHRLRALLVPWSPIPLMHLEALSARHAADAQETVAEPRKWEPTRVSTILLLGAFSNFKCFP